jgi:stearoyl-CoA desaturase (delta-9 desaturase)
MILLIGTLITHGSVIAWSITHRYHHKFCDTSSDPTNPEGGWWHKVKCFFYHFDDIERPNSNVMVLDLIRDKDFVFFHKYHFGLIFAYIGLLALINPMLVLYFYCFPVCYVLFTSGWVTTLAHSPTLSIFGYRNYDSNDKTFNSVFWQLYSMGDGYHNNHHACPWLSDMAVTKYEFDICGQVVKIIGIPNNRPPLPVE